MRKLEIITTLCLILLSIVPAIADEPVKVKVGFYLTDIYALNFSDKHYTAQFWAWFNHSSKSFNVKSGIELPNSRNYKVLNYVQKEMNGNFLTQVKYETQLNHQWNSTFYPFDRQKIVLCLESSDLDSAKIKLIGDAAGSGVSPDIRLAGWTIEKMKMKIEDHAYKTSFGDPDLRMNLPSVYSRILFEVDLKRHGWRLLFNDFTGFFFAIAISGIVLVLDSMRSLFGKIPHSTKISMGTSSLFASVGAAYVLQSRMPSTPIFTFADAIQTTAFVATLMAIVSSLSIEIIQNTDRMFMFDLSTKEKQTDFALWFNRGTLGLFILIVLFDSLVLAKAVYS